MQPLSCFRNKWRSFISEQIYLPPSQGEGQLTNVIVDVTEQSSLLSQWYVYHVNGGISGL